ncbi:MAG: ATP synthase F0 subunit B [Candidatus Woykebacteria bacterium RBG_16_39_9b]|uniref:ATP synthase subunit b n=1 Tax=Candidatus Woykebacteria bacterium RBG_16_39_9b TaxID=1802595 RepID=A0A1G1WBT8_9BACT|nr:MAG: ATP synthase F0 subunit B [Candidatus Woykebacteria bacterium RBG_16_39_9b]
MEILKDFGVQPILLAAQIINFIILLLVLKRFLYKPIIKVLEERKRRIETSINQSEEIQKRFDESAKKQEEILDKAREEAKNIIENAKEESNILSEQIKTENKQSIENAMKRTQDSLELEKQKMVADAHNQIVTMVASLTEKVVPKTLKEADKEKLIQEAIKEIENEN